jgi:hypothetical protein
VTVPSVRPAPWLTSVARLCPAAVAVVPPAWIPERAVVAVTGGGSPLRAVDAQLDVATATAEALSATVIARDPGRGTYAVDAPDDGWVWIDRAWWPGWIVQVDGATVTPARAAAGQLVPVASGRHVIEQRLVPWDALPRAAAIVAALAYVAYGLPWINQALPGVRQVDPNAYYLVGAHIEVLPPAGTLLDVRLSRSYDHSGRASFVLNQRDLRYAVTVDPYRGNLEAGLARTLYRLKQVPGLQLRPERAQLQTTTGIAGLMGGFVAPTGTGRTSGTKSGRYAVFVVGGTSLVNMVVTGRIDLVAGEARNIAGTFASIRLGGKHE